MSRADEIQKFVGYVAVGGLAAVVDIGVFAGLYSETENRLGSAVLSFVVAALVNYGLSSVVVFRSALSLRRLRLFLSFAAIGFAINVSITVAGSSLLQVDPRLGKVLGIAFAFFFNYLLNRFVVFSQPSSTMRYP